MHFVMVEGWLILLMKIIRYIRWMKTWISRSSWLRGGRRGSPSLTSTRKQKKKMRFTCFWMKSTVSFWLAKPMTKRSTSTSKKFKSTSSTLKRKSSSNYLATNVIPLLCRSPPEGTLRGWPHPDLPHTKIKEFYVRRNYNPSWSYIGLSEHSRSTFRQAVFAGGRWRVHDYYAGLNQNDI